MFTFYRKFLYVTEPATGETWYWTAMNFYKSNRTLKYDYKDSTSMMILGEIVFRFILLAQCFLCFAFISLVNALLIRVTIKSSTVLLVGLASIQD
jgi:hypothetical protein